MPILDFGIKLKQLTAVSGYIWRYARTKNAKHFYRGIRTWADDGRDELKLLFQNTYGPMLLGRIWPIPTMFLEGDPRYRGVSSTAVRMLCDRIKRNEGEKEAIEERKGGNLLSDVSGKSAFRLQVLTNRRIPSKFIQNQSSNDSMHDISEGLESQNALSSGIGEEGSSQPGDSMREWDSLNASKVPV